MDQSNKWHFWKSKRETPHVLDFALLLGLKTTFGTPGDRPVAFGGLLEPVEKLSNTHPNWELSLGGAVFVCGVVFCLLFEFLCMT